jgi:hypothetical protein
MPHTPPPLLHLVCVCKVHVCACCCCCCCRRVWRLGPGRVAGTGHLQALTITDPFVPLDRPLANWTPPLRGFHWADEADPEALA